MNSKRNILKESFLSVLTIAFILCTTSYLALKVVPLLCRAFDGLCLFAGSREAGFSSILIMCLIVVYMMHVEFSGIAPKERLKEAKEMLYLMKEELFQLPQYIKMPIVLMGWFIFYCKFTAFFFGQEISFETGKRMSLSLCVAFFGLWLYYCVFYRRR